jgi:hypothetical protein
VPNWVQGEEVKQSIEKENTVAHKIQLIEAKHEITNRDVVFSVRKGSRKIGELRVSKGSLVWVTGNGRIQNSIRWSDFDEFMRKGGTWE